MLLKYPLPFSHDNKTLHTIDEKANTSCNLEVNTSCNLEVSTNTACEVLRVGLFGMMYNVKTCKIRLIRSRDPATLKHAPQVTNSSTISFNVTMWEFVDGFSELDVLTFDQRMRRILMLQCEFRRRFVRCRIRRRIRYVWRRL